MKRAIWTDVEKWTDLAVGDTFLEADSLCGQIKGKVLTKPVREAGEESFTAAMEDGRTCDYFRLLECKHYGPKLYVRIEFEI